MREKNKKIIAGIGLGLVLASGAMVTGCSMSDEQIDALNLVVGKTDEIITLVEENFDYTNQKLGKEEASELIGLVRSDFLLNNYNEIKFSVKIEGYNGAYDKKEYSRSFELYYRQSNNTKIKAQLDDGIIEEIETSDFVNDKHYEYKITIENNQETITKNEIEYKYNMWTNWEFDLFNQDYLALFGEITPEKIKNIEIIENGYRFELDTILSDGDTSIEGGNERIVLKLNMSLELIDGKIMSANVKGLQITVPCSDLYNDGENIILDENGIPDGYLASENAQVVGTITTINYQYENIDFSAIDAKIAKANS